jgi:hypothetical protein
MESAAAPTNARTWLFIGIFLLIVNEDLARVKALEKRLRRQHSRSLDVELVGTQINVVGFGAHRS